MQSSRAHVGSYLLRLLLPLALVLLAAGLLSSTRHLEAFHRSPYPLTPTPRFNPQTTLPTATTARLGEARIPVELTLMRGETATQIFEHLGLGSVEAHRASGVLAEHLDLKALRAGSRYSAFLNPDSSLSAVDITLDGSGRFHLKRQAGRWESSWQPFERSVEMRALKGTLASSFEGAIRSAGGPSALAYRMADVLQWDIDFSRDLKRGDRFQVLYEQVRLDGEDHGVGNVVALVYEGAEGRRHEAYHYGDGDVYFDADGRPLKKMFLRSPLRYSRVTSAFSMHRFHPVLGEYRPHYGVDYHAPVGTPVEVTASGVVLSAGWDGGGGNVVKVRHAGGFVTAYLHLSRFAPGIRAGSHVRQGDVIAYTGATGLASGPHLDYRVKRDEQWIDPQSLKGFRDEPIPTTQLVAFRGWRDQVRASLLSGTVPAALLKPALPPTQLAAGGRRPKGAATAEPDAVVAGR